MGFWGLGLLGLRRVSIRILDGFCAVVEVGYGVAVRGAS